MRVFAALLVACLLTGPTAAQPSAKIPPVTPAMARAMDGIFAGFRHHPLVALGDAHGLAQEQDFYAAILRDPRFARDVGNLVVEFGGAAQQKTIDRYVNGEDVPYAELRRVWTDVVGWVPTVTYQGLVNVYATVRAVNMKLPRNRRIKVWLGEPVIDWTKIKTPGDYRKGPGGQRDIHAAALIEREILAKKKKAMIIYGHWHLGRTPDSLRSIVEKNNPKAFFAVIPYTGYHEDACAARLEKSLGSVAPLLITPVRGTTWEKRIRQPGCNATDPAQVAGTPVEKQRALAEYLETNFALSGDALLYFGPKATLVRSPTMMDMYLDADLRREMDRRYRIIMGKPLGDVNGVERNPVLNRPYLP
jgi:hypothetical protein